MIGVQKLAESANLTPRRIQQLCAEGMPKAKRGQYDELECLRWYIRHLQKKLQAGESEPAEDPSGGVWVSGKDRISNVKAAMLELDLAERQKQTITIPVYEQAMADMITPARLELLAIEPRLRPVIGGDAARKCGDEIKRVLRRLGGEEEKA